MIKIMCMNECLLKTTGFGALCMNERVKVIVLSVLYMYSSTFLFVLFLCDVFLCIKPRLLDDDSILNYVLCLVNRALVIAYFFQNYCFGCTV